MESEVRYYKNESVRAIFKTTYPVAFLSLMKSILDFIKDHASGVTEEELSLEFPDTLKIDIAKKLNGYLRLQQISLFKEKGVLYYKPSPTNTDDYEFMVHNLIEQSGSEGVWLKVIKDKTNMPHNLVGKVLRSMENKRVIKSVKCLKNNRKVYVLYDQTPSEEITGGAWFHDNDVDTECVRRMLEIVKLFLDKATVVEGSLRLIDYEKNPTLDDILEYIQNLNILSIPLRLSDLKTLVDVLIFDGKAERLSAEDTDRYRAIT